MRTLTVLFTLVLAIPAAHAQQASTVYQWKDAQGVTQYSERAPTGQKADVRRISHRGYVSPESTASDTTSLPPGCVAARSNLAMLNSGAALGRDTDGDGKPDTPMSPEERTAEKNLAEAAVKAYCSNTSKP